jgi:uncharacterized membrane protein
MAETTPNSRLEAFCDGVFAIALTLLIIDIKIPSGEHISNTTEFWLALKHMSQSVFAFVLSFIIILITWVNHHANLKLISRSTASFIYANGFLLLTVVFMPFPTSLMGEYLFTDHASPAVVLFVSVTALQAIGWILITRTALSNHLCKNEKAILSIRENNRYGYFALVLYSLCTLLAFWFPLSIALATALIWIFWLVLSINMKHE